MRLDPPSGTWTADLLVDGTRTDGGPALTGLTGRYRVTAGLILTAKVVDVPSLI